MTSIGATAAAATLTAKDLSGAEAPRPRRPEQDAEALRPVAAGDRGPFSAGELGRILDALSPFIRGDDDDAAIVEGVLGRLAEKRAAGQDAVLVATSIPGGGGIGTIMGADEFAAALASGDRGSLGSIRTDDGADYSVRDLVRAMLGAAEGGATLLSARDAIAVAVANMMADAAGDERADAAAAKMIRALGAAINAAATAGDGQAGGSGVSVSLVVLPAKAPDAAGRGGGALLLDLAA